MVLYGELYCNWKIKAFVFLIKAMALCGELYCNWEIKAFACIIKAMVLCVRNRQGKGYCNAFFLPKQSKGGFIPIF
jgi:hypothetical protein